MKKIILFFLFFVSAGTFYAQNTVSISGQVTDFEGNPIDSSVVQLLSRGFEVINKTYSDKNGYYKLENVDKGKYMAMYVIRPKEYPRQNAVPEKDMRL
ncbi:MAG: carboxypeptidase-like regulatory domain-containing protein, partial [Dysgonomonas sp.]